MNKLILSISLILLVGLVVFVSAEKFTVTIRGEPRTPDNQIDLMYTAGIADDTGEIESDKTIDNNQGYFEVRNVVLDTEARFDHISVFVGGGCFNHNYNIFRRNNQFEIVDAYKPDQGVVLTTKSNNIDLGVLKEDKSNLVWVDSNIPVIFTAFDMNGNEVAANSGYKKDTGMSDSFKSNTQYKISLKSQKRGEEWERTITTGDYCESTRIIQRGDYFIVENFSNNTLPKIGFWKNIKLFFKGLFS